MPSIFLELRPNMSAKVLMPVMALCSGLEFSSMTRLILASVSRAELFKFVPTLPGAYSSGI